MQPFRRRELQHFLDQWARGDRLDAAGLDVAREATGPSFRFDGRRVLVADDSAVNREVAIEALSRLGVTSEVAVDGRQAVRGAVAGGFDLVLMDGSMPEMGGYDASREIRRRQAESGAPRLPIVALTAHVLGAAAEAWRAADMDAVLHKPFTLASLSQTLGQFLEPSGPSLAARPVAAPATAARRPALSAQRPDRPAGGRRHDRPGGGGQGRLRTAGLSACTGTTPPTRWAS